ncbi:hypothetical protein [Methylosinus sp. Sm6]|uniref:hypothetical protein n=1 Tax=Methylosinus sp. Sm6 TaxID=2866948 RepID=UPI001C99E973|nr:hypothetical protein [Methylosinus sp. Sm6]MBY6239805.1 hypothetical protein [Methylosinus sp. Sm6]
MRKQIKFAANMEALAEDENTLQDYVQEYGDNLVADFLQPPGARGFAGLGVTRKTSTVVNVAPGRYYDGAGRMYGLDQASEIDLAPYLPSVSARIVAIVCYGQVNDAHSVVRDFINPATEEATPRQVYLEKQRQVMLTVVAGTEAASPVNPVIGSTYLGVAYVRLTPAGLAAQSYITMIAANEIGSLDDAFDRVETLESWKKAVNSSVEALRTEIARISSSLKGLAGADAILTVAREVARLREEIGLPDVYTASHADVYMTASQSDTANVAWLAKVEEGVRFADAHRNEQQIALLSSIDSAVTVTPGGLMLPKYSEVVSLSIGDQARERDLDLPIAQYQMTTITGDVLKLSRLRQRYGEEFLICTNNRYWQTGEFDPVSGVFQKGGETFTVANVKEAALNHRIIRLERFFQDDWGEEYWEFGATQKSVTGKLLAQTCLATAKRWVTGYDLWITDAAATGDVTLLVCDVLDGKPDLGRVYSWVTVAAADLVDNGWTHFPLEPFVVLSKSRYAIVVVTAGAHTFKISNNNDYTQGTLYTFVDDAFAIAMPDRDLCFQEHVAKFTSTSTVVNLQPWSLDGGITGIDVLAPCVHGGGGVGLAWQFKVNNTWYTLGKINGTTPFIGLPALVQARLALTHTHDFAPGIKLAESRVALTRPRTNGVAISQAWTPPAAITTVQITVLLSSYSTTYHTIAVTLLHGAGYATEAAAASTSIRTRSDGLKVLTVNFTGLPNLTSYKWKFTFSTSNALKPFVIEEAADVAV